MENKIIYDSTIASVYFDNKGFFVYSLKESKTALDAVEAEKQFDFFNKVSDGKPMKLIVDVSKSLKLPTDESAIFFRNNYNPESYMAIVTPYSSSLLFYRQTLRYREIKNTKVFKTMEEAEDWIINL